MCGAGVIVENAEGEILLGRRRDNGLWDDAGGALELGESLEDCAKRELFEEMGIAANSLELLGVFSGQPPYTYPNGDIVENVSVVYVCRDYSGEPKAQADEVSELRWFDIEMLNKDTTQITPPSRIFLKSILKAVSNKTPTFGLLSTLSLPIPNSSLTVRKGQITRALTSSIRSTTAT
jgi:mutator protein MutT